MCLLHADFSYHLPVYVYCILLCLLLVGFLRKAVLMLCSLILDVRVLLPFDVFCFILFPSSICALCSTYYLLVTGTTYSSAAALTLQGLLALCSIALFLPYWQTLLTHSARLHGTSYCILLSNYYLFAYSYNTLNNHAYYHVSYW